MNRLLQDEQIDELVLTTLVFKGILAVCTHEGTTNLSLLHAILLEAIKNESNILFATRVFKLLGTVCSQPNVGRLLFL